MFVKGKNLFNKNAVIENQELTENGASTGYNVLWYVSEFIEVQPNTIYYLSGNRTSGTTNAFYDSNKNYISYVSTITGAITTPANAKYIRFNGKKEELNNNIMLEQSSTATTYEPYIEKEIYVKNKNGVFEEFYNGAEIPSCIKSKQVSETPDSNGFIPTGLDLDNIIIGVSNTSKVGFYIPFIENNANRLTLKCETWQKNPITEAISLMVHYIPLK